LLSSFLSVFLFLSFLLFIEACLLSGFRFRYLFYFFNFMPVLFPLSCLTYDQGKPSPSQPSQPTASEPKPVGSGADALSVMARVLHNEKRNRELRKSVRLNSLRETGAKIDLGVGFGFLVSVFCFLFVFSSIFT
jgi:hypothetical protein